MITTILLSVIALSLSYSTVNLEQNVLVRFYSNFAQLYRPATPVRCAPNVDVNNDRQCFQYRFTESEYSNIASDSMTMLYTNITERTVTYHANPNFEKVGTQYLYRPDPKANRYIEIELVNAKDHLFGTLVEPVQYFYLDSYDNLYYLRTKPVSSYYDVKFISDSSSQKDTQTESPVLAYVDKSYRWTPRYLVHFSVVDNREQSIMYAYADLSNTGSEKIVFKLAEFISGSLKPEKLNF